MVEKPAISAASASSRHLLSSVALGQLTARLESLPILLARNINSKARARNRAHWLGKAKRPLLALSGRSDDRVAMSGFG
jgi:hypothetical protein